MIKATSVAKLVCIPAMVLALGSAAHAAQARTFVSGKGSDTNAASPNFCSPAAPCRSFAAAYAITESNGEIVVLDPAAYGALTITQPIAIVGTPGTEISAPSGGAGITVNVGQGNYVDISSVQVTGLGASNTTGVLVTTGSLILRNSALRFLTIGLQANTVSGSTAVRADVLNTDIVDNSVGIETHGAGVPYNSNIGIYLTNSCTANSLCTTLVRASGGNIVDNTTALVENEAGSSGGQASATVWFYQGAIPNIGGNATLITSNSGAPSGSLETYSGGQSPY